MQNENNCAACAEGRGCGVFHAIRKQRVIRQCENFVLVPAIGSIVPYYLIVSPKNHVTSFSQIKREALHEAGSFCDKFISSVDGDYEIILAEHGETCKSIEHAHVHVLLTQKRSDVRKQFLSRLTPYSHVTSVERSIVSVFNRMSACRDLPEYSFVYDHTNALWYEIELQKIPQGHNKQFIRRVLADVVNLPWNWQAHVGSEIIERTYLELGCEHVETD